MRLSLFLILFTLSSCVRYSEVKPSNPKSNIETPQKILLFLDRSASVQGFFNEGEAITLLGNITTEFSKKNIPVEYYWFSSGCDSITSNYREFSKAALDAKAYKQGENRFSTALNAVLQKKGSKEVALILTDAVLSVKTGSFQQEQADIKYALSKYASLNKENIGIFQFKHQYSGTYYRQPADKPVSVSGVERNLFLVSLAGDQFSSLLQDVIAERNGSTNYQYFNNSYSQFIKITPIEETPLVINSVFKFSLTIDTKATEYQLDDIQGHVKILDSKKQEVEGAKINISKAEEDDQYVVECDLSESKLSDFTGDYYIRINNKTKIKPSLNALNYNVAEEPKENIDHAKTFSLSLMLEAFQYLYRDSYVFESKISIGKSGFYSPVGGAYSFLLGEQENPQWITNYLYLFLIACFLPLIASVYFYFGNNDKITFSDNPQKQWILVAIFLAPLLVFTVSLLWIFAAVEMSFTAAMSHSFLNGFYSMLFFTIYSLVLKNRNDHLRNCPL